MRVLICGSRTWTDQEKIESIMSQFPLDTVFLHGGAKGADSIAGEVATRLGYPEPEVYPVKDWHTHIDCECNQNWTRFCYAAGKRRNSLMLSKDVDRVIAFQSVKSKTGGTADAIEKAQKMGLPVDIYYDL